MGPRADLKTAKRQKCLVLAGNPICVTRLAIL